jgi:hypothetical protein
VRSEDQRKRFVDTVSKYAIEGDDASALDDDEVRSIFTDDEFEGMVERVKLELLPRLGDVRRDAESNHSSSTSPEDHMRPLFEVFESLKRHFECDDGVVELIDGEVRRMREWVDENEAPESERAPRGLGTVDAQASPQGVRSIFDDVDASGDDEPE